MVTTIKTNADRQADETPQSRSNSPSAHASELSGLSSLNSHRGYGSDQQPTTNPDQKAKGETKTIDVQGKLDKLDRQLAQQMAAEERSLISSLVPESSPDACTTEHPTGQKPTPPASSVVYSGDTVPKSKTPSSTPTTSSYPFAGDLQTVTLGANIDFPVVGDLTAAVTVEFGEEFDIGLTAEHGSVVSPFAIDDETGAVLSPDLSMGVNAYYNQGYVPFESGHVDTKEIMGQYALGPGMNFDHDRGITSLNVYGGAGVGASVTYDRTYNLSLRDTLRGVGELAGQALRWARDSIR